MVSMKASFGEDNSEEKEYWDDQIFRIEKDVKRNDRNVDIYQYNTTDGKQPLSEPTEPSEAVSYTHLDVYKRQVLGFSFCV